MEECMMKCPACNSEMIWQSDADFEDLGREDEGNGVVSFYHCSNESCDSEFTHVQKEEGERP